MIILAHSSWYYPWPNFSAGVKPGNPNDVQSERSRCIRNLSQRWHSHKTWISTRRKCCQAVQMRALDLAVLLEVQSRELYYAYFVTTLQCCFGGYPVMLKVASLQVNALMMFASNVCDATDVSRICCGNNILRNIFQVYLLFGYSLYHHVLYYPVLMNQQFWHTVSDHWTRKYLHKQYKWEINLIYLKHCLLFIDCLLIANKYLVQ